MSLPLLIAIAAEMGSEAALTGAPLRLATAPESVTTTASGRSQRSRRTVFSSHPFAQLGAPFSPLYEHLGDRRDRETVLE